MYQRYDPTNIKDYRESTLIKTFSVFFYPKTPGLGMMLYTIIYIRFLAKHYCEEQLCLEFKEDMLIMEGSVQSLKNTPAFFHRLGLE